MPLEPDMNRYDSEHVTHRTRAWRRRNGRTVYRRAWDPYYSPEHVETVIRRATEWGFTPNKIKWMMLSFHAAATIEGSILFDSGIFRRRYRRERRRAAREEPVVFYSCAGNCPETLPLVRMHLAYKGRSSPRHAHRLACADAGGVATAPDQETELGDLELFTVTAAARSAVEKVRGRVERRRSAVVTASLGQTAPNGAA